MNYRSATSCTLTRLYYTVALLYRLYCTVTGLYLSALNRTCIVPSMSFTVPYGCFTLTLLCPGAVCCIALYLFSTEPSVFYSSVLYCIVQYLWSAINVSVLHSRTVDILNSDCKCTD